MCYNWPHSGNACYSCDACRLEALSVASRTIILFDFKILLLRYISIDFPQLFIGLGDPVEGPGVIEALAKGCIFLNPKFKGKRQQLLWGKPTFRLVRIILLNNFELKNPLNLQILSAISKMFQNILDIRNGGHPTCDLRHC